MNTTGFPPDGRDHYRERKEYGNRHAIFERGAEWGTAHYDEYNAIDFPNGTFNHAARYTSEKTGVSETAAKVVLVAIGLIAVGLIASALRRR
ncbi:MAG: hypothetical protein HMLIMOIP_002373 [Candidatus Nitrosomirales archaeon]|jgi:hypothetical protein